MRGRTRERTALREAEEAARSERAERQARVVRAGEQQRSLHDGGGLVDLQATAESAAVARFTRR